jgi:hypothetical protein
MKMPSMLSMDSILSYNHAVERAAKHAWLDADHALDFAVKQLYLEGMWLASGATMTIAM